MENRARKLKKNNLTDYKKGLRSSEQRALNVYVGLCNSKGMGIRSEPCGKQAFSEIEFSLL